MGRLDKDADGYYLDKTMRLQQYARIDKERHRSRLWRPWPEEEVQVEQVKPLPMKTAGQASYESLKRELRLQSEEIVRLRNSVALLQGTRNPRGTY
jgi:hypothetical protein